MVFSAGKATRRSTAAEAELTPSPASDAAKAQGLVARWQAGIDREECFQVLFNTFYRRVYEFFERRGLRSQDCHDLSQETFLQVHLSLEKFRGESRFETWLFQVTLNTFRKAMRLRLAHKRAGEEISLDAKGEASSERAAAELSSSATVQPLEEALWKERLAAVAQVLEDLPEKMRLCVKLRLCRDLSDREIALLLGLTEESVKAYRYQARQRLKTELAGLFDEIPL